MRKLLSLSAVGCLLSATAFAQSIQFNGYIRWNNGIDSEDFNVNPVIYNSTNLPRQTVSVYPATSWTYVSFGSATNVGTMGFGNLSTNSYVVWGWDGVTTNGVLQSNQVAALPVNMVRTGAYLRAQSAGNLFKIGVFP